MLIEDLLSGKTGLGAAYRFQPESLEVKKNKAGVSGVFTRIDVSEGAEVISIPKVNGTLTTIRAYEEARDLLARLGPERFSLNQEFIEASALYLRYRTSQENGGEICFLDPDLLESFGSTPMQATHSEALTALMNFNDRSALESSRAFDSLVDRLDVDGRIFRSLVAYSQSRGWAEFGLIPIFDLLNSSYGNSANCAFVDEGSVVKFTARRDIAAGEELTWNYNNKNAIGTWLGYGYVDPERPLAANLELRLDEEERDAFERFLKTDVGLNQEAITPRLKVDSCIFQYFLAYPGEPASKQVLRREIASALSSFKVCRAWMRAYVLSKGKTDADTVSVTNLQSDQDIFGVTVERRMISEMRSALTRGGEEEQKRIDRFKKTDVGAPVDVAPYGAMRNTARTGWDGALSIISGILSARTEPDAAGIIRDSFGLDVGSKNDAISALKEADLESPTVASSLTLVYLADFLS